MGRSAAAKESDAHTVHLAVMAHIRHAETNYDELLSAMVDRREVRMQVRDAVSEVLDKWQ